MRKKQIIRISVIIGVIILVVGGATAAYMFNMPHRDVQSVKTDLSLTAEKLVQEYLIDAEAANARYLDEEGESKVLEVSGTVASVKDDFNGNKVVLLKNENSPAGVSCTFLPEQSAIAVRLEAGQEVKVKGVIRAGAAYDEDLELYEHVVLDKCALVN